MLIRRDHLRGSRALSCTVARIRPVARPGGPESSLFGSGLRALGRGLTLEFLLWHGVDMYIEQLTHEDIAQTTRSAPVTAATTWTFLHRSRPRHQRGAETCVAMHVTGLTSARNYSAVLSVHDNDSHSARYMHVAPISSTSLIISHQVDACSTVTSQHFFSH